MFVKVNLMIKDFGEGFEICKISPDVFKTHPDSKSDHSFINIMLTQKPIKPKISQAAPSRDSFLNIKTVLQTMAIVHRGQCGKVVGSGPTLVTFCSPAKLL